MYPLLALFIVIVGICLFAFANRMTKRSAVVIGIKVVGIVLIIVGLSLLYLLLSGKVILPLSNG